MAVWTTPKFKVAMSFFWAHDKPKTWWEWRSSSMLSRWYASLMCECTKNQKTALFGLRKLKVSEISGTQQVPVPSKHSSSLFLAVFRPKTQHDWKLPIFHSKAQALWKETQEHANRTCQSSFPFPSFFIPHKMLQIPRLWGVKPSPWLERPLYAEYPMGEGWWWKRPHVW